jgi:hypothetical protein
MGAPVEIQEVTLAEPDPALVRGFELEAPSAGAPVVAPGAYAMTLRGWVVGSSQPAVAVEVFDHKARMLWRVPLTLGREQALAAHPGAPGVELNGFAASIGLLKVPANFELAVHAVLQDESRVHVATLRGRRPPLRTGFDPELAPLMLTSIPRVGSTIFIRILGMHPAVVAYPPFEHEPRVASYWLEAFRALSQPASYLRQVAPPRDFQPGWWVGDKPPLVWRLRGHPELQEWMGGAAVEALAAFCQERIDSFYRQLALHENKPQAAFFAEKFHIGPLQELLWELYPAAREIVMVRDFRDVACSIFSRRAGRGEPFSTAEQELYIERNLAERVSKLLRDWRSRGDHVKLVRYEDLIREPAETVAAVLTYLGLEAGAEEVERMLDEAAEAVPAMDIHRTSSDTADSVGRWRRDLAPEVQASSLQSLGSALEELGYPRG